MEKNVITDSVTDYKKGTGTPPATTYTTHNHSIQQKLEKKELPDQYHHTSAKYLWLWF